MDNFEQAKNWPFWENLIIFIIIIFDQEPGLEKTGRCFAKFNFAHRLCWKFFSDFHWTHWRAGKTSKIFKKSLSILSGHVDFFSKFLKNYLKIIFSKGAKNHPQNFYFEGDFRVSPVFLLCFSFIAEFRLMPILEWRQTCTEFFVKRTRHGPLKDSRSLLHDVSYLFLFSFYDGI